MKLCRFVPFEDAARGEARSGIIEGELVAEIRGEPWAPAERTGQQWRCDAIKLLAPSTPTKIVCVGRNFAAHASELGNELPKEPLIFLKPPSSIIAPGEKIVLPSVSKRVDFEGELAIIMGRRCRRPPAGEDANSYIAGYTCLNDVTARDLQKPDGQWWRAKGCDTFCPFGPVLETELIPAATVETFVNGIRKQFGSISDWIFSPNVIIRWIAQVMTLEPGDVVAMGTPEGVGPLSSGDTVEVVVTGIGTLRNTVTASTE
ncbi:MAG TPA: fumarylacetoacetate hydrolase family protein [Candidatus Acidoferrales bacterium]|nr:fumarylacetoacetate hydrolase family protein [Candidatus Acidoferrales bacterium]